MRHFQKGGPLDNCKKGGARGDRLIRLTQYPPLVVLFWKLEGPKVDFKPRHVYIFSVSPDLDVEAQSH